MVMMTTSSDDDGSNKEAEASSQPHNTRTTAFKSSAYYSSSHHSSADASSGGHYSASSARISSDDSTHLSTRSNFSSSSSSAPIVRLDTRTQEPKIIISNTTHTRRMEKAMADFTINKLDTKFSSMGLIGRDKEISTIRSCVQRLVKQHKETMNYSVSSALDYATAANTTAAPPSLEYSTSLSYSTATVNKEVILIHGPSGVGKSTLASILKQDVAKMTNGILVEGKYEITTMDEPLSGIAQVFRQICQNVLKGGHDGSDSDGDALRRNVKKSIESTMGDDAKILAELIPELEEIIMEDEQNFHHDGNEDSTSSSDNKAEIIISIEKRQERWKFAFRMLTRVLGSSFLPIVLVLDDLQWADEASLEVLDYLISDVQNPHALMVVGCYRSNNNGDDDEVDEDSLLYKRIQILKGKCKKFQFRITDIAVGSCNVDGVNQMIMSMMSVDDEEYTRELARVCFKRTLGNPFFLIEFMKMLQVEGLLEYSIGLTKWTFDVSKIEDATMSTANVVELLQGQMRKLPGDVQLLLQYAACLGSSFSFSTLEYVLRYEAILSITTSDHVKEVLGLALDARLIESAGPQKLRWVHDKVQEAALSLSDLVTPSFQFQLGVCLYQGLGEKELEEQLFDIADLINKDVKTHGVDLAALNLRAATKARSMSAFQSAARYSANGIRLLPQEPWSMHRKLALELYSMGAEMQVAVGRVDLAEEYIDIVLEREDCSQMEKMRVQMVKMTLLSSVQLRFGDAVEHGLTVLHDMGYDVLWSRRLVLLQALALATRTIKTVKQLPVDHFEKLGPMKDPRQRALVNLMVKIWYSAYACKNIPLNIMCVCRMVEMTLSHGVSLVSGQILASLCSLALYLSPDRETTLRFAEMAMSMDRRCGGSRIAEVSFTLYAFALSWYQPMHSFLAPTMNAYAQGLRVGDNEYGCWNLLFHFVHLPYMMGKNLDSILEEYPKILLQLGESNLEAHTKLLNALAQMMVNLKLPPSNASKILDGEIFCYATDSEGHAGLKSKIHFAENELLVYFGDFEALATRDLEMGNYYAKSSPNNFMIPTETFSRGIALYAMARRTKMRRYKGRAVKIRKMIAKWEKNGNPNVKHFDVMLRAEQAALDRKYDLADELYKEAIVCAARPGFLQHAALFNERYADYRLTEHGDTEDGKYYLSEAVRYYIEWGAVGKAEQLRKDMEEL